MKNRYARQQAETAVIHGDGTRHCAWCGDYIDPIDWCLDCRSRQTPCGTHRRLRKRADAAFCDPRCRSAYHSDSGPTFRRSAWSA